MIHKPSLDLAHFFVKTLVDFPRIYTTHNTLKRAHEDF